MEYLFPVRLLYEMYGRAVNYLHNKKDLVVYDPCCGGGYALTVLGFMHNDEIRKIYGSDIDEFMLDHAKKNTRLLTMLGLNSRRNEIESLYKEYGKHSHVEALNSCDKLKGLLKHEICADIFQADCTEALLNFCRISSSQMYLMEILLDGKMESKFP